MDKMDIVNLVPVTSQNDTENYLEKTSFIEMEPVVNLSNTEEEDIKEDGQYIIEIEPLIVQNITDDDFKEETFAQEFSIDHGQLASTEDSEDILFSDVTGHNITLLAIKTDTPPSPYPLNKHSEASRYFHLLGNKKRELRVVLQRCQLDENGKPIKSATNSPTSQSPNVDQTTMKPSLKNKFKTVKLLPASKKRKNFLVSVDNIFKVEKCDRKDKKPSKKWNPKNYHYVPKRKGKKKNPTKMKKENVCKWCGKYFKKLYMLLRHQQNQRLKDSYRCPLCFKPFEYKCVLQQHFASEHGAEDRKYACENCELKFFSNSSLDRHKLTHTELLPFECPECRQRFRRKDHVVVHMRVMHPKEFNHICQICGGAFKDKYKLAKHMTQAHNCEGLLKCPQCPKTLNSKKGMVRHIATHDEKKFFCTENDCELSFYSSSELVRHLQRHSNATNYKCNFCDRKFKAKVDVGKHLRRSNCRNKLPFKCTVSTSCRKHFTDQDRLREHEMTHTDGNRFKCNQEGCNKFFRLKTNQIAHVEYVHRQNPQAPTPALPVEVEIALNPKETPMKTIKKRKLIVCLQRLQLGKADSRFVQPKWFKYFKGYCYLKKCVVKNAWYWRCSELQTMKCQATLIEDLTTGDMKRGLRKHNHPPDPKKKLCDNPVSEAEKLPTANSGANASATKEEGAKVDIVPLDKLIGESTDGFFIVKRKKRKVHPCTHCEKTFWKKSNWVIHVRTHTGEKPFACPFCNKRFATNGTLLSHKRTHTNEKIYKCPECSYRGITSTNVKSHVLRHHSPDRPTFECDQCERFFYTKAGHAAHMRNHNGETPYECSVCQEGFFKSNDLAIHKKMHTNLNQTVNICTVCDYECSSPSALRRHEKLVHSEPKIYYKCRSCPKKFNSQDSIKGHCIRKHFVSSVDFCEEDYYLL